jgi:hypothetical protein
MMVCETVISITEVDAKVRLIEAPSGDALGDQPGDQLDESKGVAVSDGKEAVPPLHEEFFPGESWPGESWPGEYSPDEFRPRDSDEAWCQIVMPKPTEDPASSVGPPSDLETENILVGPAGDERTAWHPDDAFHSMTGPGYEIDPGRDDDTAKDSIVSRVDPAGGSVNRDYSAALAGQTPPRMLNFDRPDGFRDVPLRASVPPPTTLGLDQGVGRPVEDSWAESRASRLGARPTIHSGAADAYFQLFQDARITASSRHSATRDDFVAFLLCRSHISTLSPASTAVSAAKEQPAGRRAVPEQPQFAQAVQRGMTKLPGEKTTNGMLADVTASSGLSPEQVALSRQFTVTEPLDTPTKSATTSTTALVGGDGGELLPAGGEDAPVTAQAGFWPFAWRHPVSVVGRMMGLAGIASGIFVRRRSRYGRQKEIA